MRAPISKAAGPAPESASENVHALHRAQQGLAAIDSRHEALSHELHDSVAQQLAFVAIQAARLERMLQEQPAAQKLIADLRLALCCLQKQVREMISGARSPAPALGLRDALVKAVDELRSRSHVVFKLDNRLADSVLSPACELQVLHIVREALANAVRHARAQQVHIRLWQDGTGAGLVNISVADDGVGVHQMEHLRWQKTQNAANSGHYGMQIMQERARSIGASLLVHSATGKSRSPAAPEIQRKGTCVHLQITLGGTAA